MEKFIKGDIVVIPFPFSDLSTVKRRPCLVLAALMGADLILCQITSRKETVPYSIPLDDTDIVNGQLNVKSLIRPNRIFTADKNIIIRKVGTLNQTKLDEVRNKLFEIFS